MRVVGFGAPGVIKVTHPTLPPGRYTLAQAGLQVHGDPALTHVEVVPPEAAHG